MPEVAMHEHVGDQLEKPEIRCLEKVKAENVGQIDIETSQGDGGQIHQNVDNQQMLDHGRQHSESCWTVLFVHLKKSSIFNNT